MHAMPPRRGMLLAQTWGPGVPAAVMLTWSVTRHCHGTGQSSSQVEQRQWLGDLVSILLYHSE